jgi:hypothetical protein
LREDARLMSQTSLSENFSSTVRFGRIGEVKNMTK